MNKKILPYVSVWVITVVIIGALLFSIDKTQAPTDLETSSWKISTWVVSYEKEDSQKLMEENINLWQRYAEWKIWSIKCEMKTEQEWWVINQTVYISWEKVRMDSYVANEVWSNESFMINDWEYTYVWWTTWPAIKMKNEVETQKVESETNDVQDSNFEDFDISKNLEQIPYNKCSEWKEDDTMFKTPVWVDFMDMDQYKNDMMKKSAEWMWISVEEMENMMQDFQWGDK